VTAERHYVTLLHPTFSVTLSSSKHSGGSGHDGWRRTNSYIRTTWNHVDICCSRQTTNVQAAINKAAESVFPAAER